MAFSPDPAEAGTGPGTAITGTDGTFRLQTNLAGGKTETGLAPGNYKVTVSKFVPPQGMSEEVYAKKVEAAGTGPFNPNAAPPKVELLPAAYSALGTTKVTATVTASGPNEITIAIP